MRRLYETMVYWETAHNVPDQAAFVNDCAELWQVADKIVHSKALQDGRKLIGARG